MRREVDAQDAGKAKWNPASESLDTLDGMPSVASGKTPGDGRLFSGREGDPEDASTASPRERSDVH